MRDNSPLPMATGDNSPDRRQVESCENPTVTLRVLATTDLHMQFLGHDYVKDAPTGNHGLAGLAQLISDARRDAKAQGFACLLVDNGDLLQGGPLADAMAKRGVDKTHPTIAAINHLRYDALGLGNHDLDYGLDYVQAVSAQVDMPVLASNLVLKSDSNLHTSALLHAAFPTGISEQSLTVGVVSVLPEQTAVWNSDMLRGRGTVEAATVQLQRIIPKLRAAGAEIVLLLAHMGIGQDGADCALSLAQEVGADAVVAGHTHRRFPGNGLSSAQVGLSGARPAVMPGYEASDLAILDLTLVTSGTGKWQLCSHDSRLVPNTAATLPSPAIQSICAAAHQAVRTELSQPLGLSTKKLHNFFDLVMPTKTGALLASAKAAAIKDAVSGTPDANLPILASTSAHTAGGLQGPSHYLNIPPGPILRRHLAGLTPYTDGIWGLKVTGATVRLWLEKAARIFQHLHPRDSDQKLINPDIPSFDFDTIYGVHYVVDPTRPEGERIADLTYQGAAVEPEQMFLLATKQFRATGGGGLLTEPNHGIIHRSPQRLVDVLADTLRDPEMHIWQGNLPWRFAAQRPTQAIFETTPEALHYLDEVAHLSPDPLGRNKTGFERLRVHIF